MVRYAIKLLMIWLFSMLAGCISGLAPERIIKINIKANEQLNSYLGVESNPVFIQVLQLKNVDSFQDLDFTRLYNDPAKALGEGMVYLAPPFPVKPGEIITKIIKPEADARFIGLLYFFNDFEKATTRHWFPVRTDKKQCLNLFLNNTLAVMEKCS
ncbi:type VI secretion system lipoprotein TssJ [Endozoicomonas sp.]|uniref:type VI secretion system lipoprotein TssJ n=1 Tax=Endozoicomonas sp. TaxID=1892382 RepID=UPI00383A2D1A